MSRTFGVIFSLALAFLIYLTRVGYADTLLNLKCSFGPIQEEILYVINSTTNDVTVIGGFGRHKAYLVSYDEGEGFYFVLEPNRGASASTLIYFKAGETPVGIRSTLALVRPDQYQGLSDTLKLAGDRLHYMAIGEKGRCSVPR